MSIGDSIIIIKIIIRIIIIFASALLILLARFGIVWLFAWYQIFQEHLIHEFAQSDLAVRATWAC